MPQALRDSSSHSMGTAQSLAPLRSSGTLVKEPQNELDSGFCHRSPAVSVWPKHCVPDGERGLRAQCQMTDTCVWGGKRSLSWRSLLELWPSIARKETPAEGPKDSSEFATRCVCEGSLRQDLAAGEQKESHLWGDTNILGQLPADWR